MKNYSPFTIAVGAIAIAFIWSLASAQLSVVRDGMPLPTTASVTGAIPAHN